MQENLKSIRWGMLGCGHIAHTFARSFEASEDGELIACAASAPSRAKAFAAEYNIPKAHGSYQALLEDKSIDVVYVATTHNFHFEHVMLSLKFGKHVLCEKPLTVNAKQTAAIKAEANKRGLFVLEAVWTRFLPAIQALKQAIEDGMIGHVTTVYANFSLNREMDDEHRLMNKRLAGGALLDLGIYPITLADIVFDKPVKNACANAMMTHTGVDKVSNYMLSYEGGQTALLSAGFRQSAVTEATIYGDKGFIRVPHFLGANQFELCIEGNESVSHEYNFADEHKFTFEINHVNDCLKKGLQESPILPLSKSLALLELMDKLRAQFSLSYPDD